MSIAIATKSKLTPDDLLNMPENKNYELVGGELVERNMGSESSWVGGRLIWLVSKFCEGKRLGWVFPADNGYQCFAHDPDLVRRPDVSFVRDVCFPGAVLPKGWCKILPDLAVEVVSPNDTVYQLDEKLEDYRKAGVPLIWVINPNSRIVRVIRGDGSISHLNQDSELSGEYVIPGFRCEVRELLPPLEPTPQDQAKGAGPKDPQ